MFQVQTKIFSYLVLTNNLDLGVHVGQLVAKSGEGDKGLTGKALLGIIGGLVLVGGFDLANKDKVKQLDWIEEKYVPDDVDNVAAVHALCLES